MTMNNSMKGIRRSKSSADREAKGKPNIYMNIGALRHSKMSSSIDKNRYTMIRRTITTTQTQFVRRFQVNWH